MHYEAQQQIICRKQVSKKHIKFTNYIIQYTKSNKNQNYLYWNIKDTM